MSNMTIEERTMLRDYILLKYMEQMVQNSLGDIEHSANILKRLYLMAGNAVLGRIKQDQYRMRRELKQSNIKILGDEQTDFVIYHQINCRGYTERFGLTRDVMKAEIGLQLTKYTSELGDTLKEASTKAKS
ncbi:hypothetical protein [Paenibacillus sp. P46E]|uniref:hypothetical protein n=1 Tax=Paenibacillus sp. P46E TaxID=1349436 RepID=UPI00093A458D|nr:hypothetical protein [Paenibacillus sp. P46E]OKP97763.1 hypothetical protein A3849_13740 [Paenibacillus sp. P46E]